MVTARLLQFILVAALPALWGCGTDNDPVPAKEDETGPEVVLISNGNLLPADTVVGPNERLLLGISVTKRAQPLQEYRFSFSTAGIQDSVLSQATLTGADQERYSRSEEIITGRVAATTVYAFRVTDASGEQTTASVRVRVE